MWVSGSLIASSRVLSSSVSLPIVSSSTSLPVCRARSRTIRGYFDQALSIGCIRVFMTEPWSSVVMRSSRCSVATSAASSVSLVNCRIWLRLRTSSPTRFISVSSRSTSTRMVESGAAGTAACCPSASTTSWEAITPWSTRISPTWRGFAGRLVVQGRGDVLLGRPAGRHEEVAHPRGGGRGALGELPQPRL
jgi:hypothetical protein